MTWPSWFPGLSRRFSKPLFSNAWNAPAFHLTIFCVIFVCLNWYLLPQLAVTSSFAYKCFVKCPVCQSLFSFERVLKWANKDKLSSGQNFREPPGRSKDKTTVLWEHGVLWSLQKLERTPGMQSTALKLATVAQKGMGQGSGKMPQALLQGAVVCFWISSNMVAMNIWLRQSSK